MNINKNNLLVSKVCGKSDNARSVLQAVHFTPEYTEGCDGNRIVRISYPGQVNPDDLPENVKTLSISEIKPFLIPAESVKDIKFFKSGKQAPLPFMTQSYIDVEATNSNGSAFFTSTNLESISKPEIKKIEEKYPDTQAVFPTTESIVTIGINSKFIAEIADIATTITDRYNNHPLLIKVYGEMQAIELSAEDKDTGQKMVSLLMPLRVPDDEAPISDTLTDAISKFIAAIEEKRLTAIEVNALPISDILKKAFIKTYFKEVK